jgi:hypothetical protein
VKTAQIVGIDPGLRDTGVVHMTFEPDMKVMSVSTLVVHHSDVDTTTKTVKDWLDQKPALDPARIFIERYVPRPGMSTSPMMTELERGLAMALPRAELVRNTGVKQIIPQDLMQMLKVWTFSTPTNHDDLRAAARIGLYGMAKDVYLNKILADVVRALLDGDPWLVDRRAGDVSG